MGTFLVLGGSGAIWGGPEAAFFCCLESTTLKSEIVQTSTHWSSCMHPRASHIFQNRLAIAGQLKYIYGTPKIEILMTRTQNRATAAGFPDFSLF